MGRVKDFARKHKKAIIITTSVVGVLLVGGTAIYLNREKLSNLFKAKDIIDTTVAETDKVSKVVPIIDYSHIKLTGEKLTPTGLGRFAGVSNQKINKMLVEKGLQEKLPCGEYKPTALGERFGKSIDKWTKYDYPFSNIEWDKSVLDILFGEGYVKQRAEYLKQIQNFFKKECE